MTIEPGTVSLILWLLTIAGIVVGWVTKFTKVEDRTETLWKAHEARSERNNMLARMELKTDEMWAGHGEIAQRVNTMWEFTYRRGAVGLVHKGMAEVQSPIKLTVQGINQLWPLMDRLQGLWPAWQQWHAETPDLTEGQLAERLERYFGDLIMAEVCLTQHMTEADCLVAIILMCREMQRRQSEGGLANAPAP